MKMHLIVNLVILVISGSVYGQISDNFEDGTIDSTLWVVGGGARGWRTDDPLGTGPWSYSLSEVDATDGYLRARVWGPISPGGLTYGAEAWVRTAYNFNDGKPHLINFTWEADVRDTHHNHYLIQITDGFIPYYSDLHWPAEDHPGTTNLLWGTSPSGEPYRGIYFASELGLGSGLPKSTWSITIDPSGIGRLYDDSDGTGTLLHEETLDKSYPWYVRFMVSDGTSAGFPAGDARLNLYSFSAEETSGGPPPPPQTAKVVYHSYSSYNNWDSRLYLLDLEVQEGKWISDDWNTVDHAMNAHFDPNGNRIVFMAVPKGAHLYNNFEIYLWELGGGEPKRLTDNSVADEDPKFSPDGRTIVFKSDGYVWWDAEDNEHVEPGHIHIMNSDGTNVKRLTENTFEESMPYYTKDGTRRVLYTSGTTDRNKNIRIVNENRTNDHYVDGASAIWVQEYYPVAWYDDTFLYTRWNLPYPFGTVDQIYSCDISSGSIESLAINTGHETVNNSDAYPMNRDYILFSSTRSGSDYDLFIGNVDTGEFWPITAYDDGVNTTNQELGAACWPANVSSEIFIELASHADLHVYDPEGRHTGIDYISNTVEEGIPGSDFKILDEAGNEVPYDGHTPGEGLRQVISLPEIQAGTYRIEIIGTSEGPFRITVSGVQDGYTMTSQSYEGDIVKGVRLSTDVEMVSVLDGLTLIWEGQFFLQLEVVVDFEPDTLNPKSQGNFVTAYIELPKGFDASNIDVTSLMLNNSVRALSKPSEVGDYDEDWIPDLMAKFDYQQVVQVLEPGVQMVVLTGLLRDETPLAGFDFVRVIGNISVQPTEAGFDWAVQPGVVAAQGRATTTESDLANTVVYESFAVKEGVAFMLSETCQIISELDPENFNSEESAIELTTTIDTMFTMLNEGLYLEALAVLDNDVLQKMDGCANSGAPDEDDWITSVEGQALLYPLVIETSELLDRLIQ